MNSEQLAKVLQGIIETKFEIKTNDKKAREVLDELFDAIADTVTNGDKVRISGFGDFDKVERSARKGRNPQTGKEIDIPATFAAKFKPAKALKDKVKGE